MPNPAIMAKKSGAKPTPTCPKNWLKPDAKARTAPCRFHMDFLSKRIKPIPILIPITLKKNQETETNPQPKMLIRPNNQSLRDHTDFCLWTAFVSFKVMAIHLVTS